MNKYLRGLGIALMLGIAGIAYAQSIPPGGQATCEQSLDAVRAENIALRKQLAQTMFQSALYEEQATALKKQVADADAKTKAEEKKEWPIGCLEHEN